MFNSETRGESMRCIGKPAQHAGAGLEEEKGLSSSGEEGGDDGQRFASNPSTLLTVSQETPERVLVKDTHVIEPEPFCWKNTARGARTCLARMHGGGPRAPSAVMSRCQELCTHIPDRCQLPELPAGRKPPCTRASIRPWSLSRPSATRGGTRGTHVPSAETLLLLLLLLFRLKIPALQLCAVKAELCTHVVTGPEPDGGRN